MSFDIETIKNQVKEVIKESQHFSSLNLNVDKLISDWLTAKEDFIMKMNGELIYQTDELISFELDTKSKKERLSRFADLVLGHYNNEPLSDYLYSLKLEDFYNNKTSQKYECYGDIVVPKNYKVVKSFKFFISDEDVLKDIQNEASRIIQEDIINGYLCFSVHPLDFLSASENVHNWRSCHALDGEYRTGNLNYLMDSCTAICYLRAEKEAILPHFPESVPWNSKKWRTWVYFSNDKAMMFLGRQYPFSSDTGINLLKDTILPKLHFGEWGPYCVSKVDYLYDTMSEKTFKFDKMIPIGEELKSLHKVVVNGKHTHMYNDILNSSCYDAIYAYKKSHWFFSYSTGDTNDKTVFNVGVACSCPICGEDIIDEPEIMACHNCISKYGLISHDDENFCVCEICGNSTHIDNTYYLELSDMYVCPECYENETARCECCGIVDMPERIKYYEGMYLCPDCIFEKKRKTSSKKIFF